MVRQKQLALNDAADWLGDWHPLTEQLGSANGLVELGSVSTLLRLPQVRDRQSLQRFLTEYHARILFPLELPAIQTAFHHASHNELRELVAFDQQLAGEPLLQHFAGPSQRAGQTQLRKLRPLRDSRFVQRYLNAVETGQAHGWHTLIYGLTLSIYSLPLRQGSLGYCHQTTRGFIYAAARSLQLSEFSCRVLFDSLCADLPVRLQTTFGPPSVAPASASSQTTLEPVHQE